MGAILIKNATIVDAMSSHHLKKRDILIVNGTINQIGTNILTQMPKKLTNLIYTSLAAGLTVALIWGNLAMKTAKQSPTDWQQRQLVVLPILL